MQTPTCGPWTGYNPAQFGASCTPMHYAFTLSPCTMTPCTVLLHVKRQYNVKMQSPLRPCIGPRCYVRLSCDSTWIHNTSLKEGNHSWKHSSWNGWYVPHLDTGPKWCAWLF